MDCHDCGSSGWHGQYTDHDAPQDGAVCDKSSGDAEIRLPEQTITSGDLLTLAHGLGAVPSALQFRLVCKISEHGYAVGAVIATELAQTGGGTIINTASMSAANVNIRFSSAANCFTAANFSTGAPVTLTNANWRLVVLAWL